MVEEQPSLLVREIHMDLVDSKFSLLNLTFDSVVLMVIFRGVFEDSSLGLVLYYHYADRSGAIGDGNYKFGWNKLSWSGGWPVV